MTGVTEQVERAILLAARRQAGVLTVPGALTPTAAVDALTSQLAPNATRPRHLDEPIPNRSAP